MIKDLNIHKLHVKANINLIKKRTNMKNKEALYKNSGHTAKVFLTLVISVLMQVTLNGQSVMGPANQDFYGGALQPKLVSSSEYRDHRFSNPFLLQNTSSAFEQFIFNNSTNTLSFYIERMGATQSHEKRLHVLFNNVEVDYIKTSRITREYDETHIVRESEPISTPDHSIFNVLPSGAGTVQRQSFGYDLGVSDWQGGVEIEIKFKERIDNDFIMTLMVTNPNQVRRFGEEVVQFFAAPLRLLGRLLGESRYSDYVSFANFHFEKDKLAFNCNNLNLTTDTYSERNNLASSVQRDLGRDYSVADWNDLKAIRNIDAWISCMGLQPGESFMVTLNGNPRLNNGTRQFFVRYAPGGVSSSFAVHERIDNKLFLGSWHGLNLKILGKTR